MQRDRSVDRTEASETAILMLDEEFLIEQSPPKGHRFPG
jgi:hypothetical protein